MRTRLNVFIKSKIDGCRPELINLTANVIPHDDINTMRLSRRMVQQTTQRERGE